MNVVNIISDLNNFFDVTSDSVQVVISPKALTTAAITGQAIFLLTDE